MIVIIIAIILSFALGHIRCTAEKNDKLHISCTLTKSNSIFAAGLLDVQFIKERNTTQMWQTIKLP